jgi:DNA-binding response OmpR family regulator
VPTVFICTSGEIPEDLKDTILWRDDVERRITRTASETLSATETARPDLVLVDSAHAGAENLITILRAGAKTRSLSIAVLAHGDFDPAEVRLLESGANTILRLPCTPDWDDRLATLMSVAPRRTARLAVTLQFEATSGDGVVTVAGTVLNLSERGMLVETDVALAIGIDIDFRIHLRDGPQPLIGCGQVVRQDAARRCGVNFYGLEADGVARVRRFVKVVQR